MRPAEKTPSAAGRAVRGARGVVPRPALWARLDGPAWVTVVSAPAGSGKTVLLRSWIGEAGLAEHAQILDLVAGNTPAPASAAARAPLEPLTMSEIRVLRYLPTHLSAPEIAGELSVSTTTVKTHLRNLYAKLGVHRRAEAVERAHPRTARTVRPPALTQRRSGHGAERGQEFIPIVRWPLILTAASLATRSSPELEEFLP